MSALTFPIARLRAAGCKVSTVIGHWPKAAIYHYSIKIPDGIPLPPQSSHSDGRSQIRRHVMSDRVIVRAIWPRPADATGPTPGHLADTYGWAAARALDALADHVEQYDRASSASSQHYIDTGRYLTKAEVEEARPPLPGPDSFACAECGTTEAETYVVTGPVDDEEERTEVCRKCDDIVRLGLLVQSWLTAEENTRPTTPEGEWERDDEEADVVADVYAEVAALLIDATELPKPR